MQTINTPSGETLVVLELDEYEALVDAAAAHDVLARIAAGEEELVPADVVDRLLEGGHPVRVWRDHRGMTGRALAQAAGISPAYLSEIEHGRKAPSLATLRRLADVLNVDLDDLAPAAP
jgi:DNA-binding XRE family transcriptional regulator